MPGKITPKQQQILDYIKEEILSKGYPPTVREICEKVGLKSTSSVHSHLSTLENNGYIRRDPTKPRAIEIIDDEFGLVRLIFLLLEELLQVHLYLQLRILKTILHYLQSFYLMEKFLFLRYREKA